MLAGNEQEERFVWPPKPGGGGVVPAKPTPPRPVPVPAAAIEVVRSPAPAPPASPWRQMLWETERVWLGLRTPPLPERIAEAGWEPDTITGYCQRCGTTAGPHDADDTGCSTCRGGRLPWERLVRLGDYDGLLRDVVHEVKFTRWRRLGDDIGRLLGRAIRDAAAAEGLNPAQLILIPVPSSFPRRIYRGIDHALVIARGAASELDCDLVRALRRRHRPSQTSLPVSQRAGNVAGAFRFREGCSGRVAGRVVVVLDDVTTTRSTLRAACRELGRGLRSAGAAADRGASDSGATRIWTAVVAVTPSKADRKGDRRAGVGQAVEAPRRQT